MIPQAKLDFWIKNDLNVLFIGKHGVGKSSIIIQAFNRAGLKWKYFSAATMDPWVDFIGVPKEKSDGNGGVYLDLVRPKEFQDDEVEALCFDEFNRGHKKVKNAVMELIQFKSINGKKFKNLRMVWAAINPEEDGEYDVEKLDPAQEDRFHVKVRLPYRPYKAYFTTKFGSSMADSAISWWDELPDEQKKLVSPRRLDYALEIHNKGGDIRDVLPVSSNISKLLKNLKSGPIAQDLKRLYDSIDQQKSKEFLEKGNNYEDSVDYILNNKGWPEFFLPLVSDERIAALVAINKSALSSIVGLCSTNLRFVPILNNIVSVSQNTKLARDIKKLTKKAGIVLSSVSAIREKNTGVPAFNDKNIGGLSYQTVLTGIQIKVSSENTYHRITTINDLWVSVPPTMITDEALIVLDILNTHCRRSQAGCNGIYSTVSSIIAVFNHCIDQICKNDNLSPSQVIKKYNSYLYYILSKLNTKYNMKHYNRLVQSP